MECGFSLVDGWLLVGIGVKAHMLIIAFIGNLSGVAAVILDQEIVNDDGKIRICGLQSKNALVRGEISPNNPWHTFKNGML